jgi:hypothetical protein
MHFDAFLAAGRPRAPDRQLQTREQVSALETRA